MDYYFVYGEEKYRISKLEAVVIAKTVDHDLVWLGGAVWQMTVEGADWLPIYPFENICFKTMTGTDSRAHCGLVLIANPDHLGRLDLLIVCPKDRRLVVEPV